MGIYIGKKAYNLYLMKAGFSGISDKIMLTNMVRDPSFEKTDLGIWSDISNFKPIDKKFGNRCMVLPNMNGSGATMLTQSMPTPIANHKYYGREYIKTTAVVSAADDRFEWFIGDGTNFQMVFARHQGNYSNWTMLSSIWELNAPAQGQWIIRYFTVNQNGGDIYSDGLMIIDLTASFGVGKEPSKEWCDAHIPFFEGSFILNKYQKYERHYNKTALTNLIPNGSFEDNSFWAGGVCDKTHSKYGSQGYKITATTSVPEVCITNSLPIPIRKGHIYYGRFEGYQEVKSGVSTQIYFPIAEPSMGACPILNNVNTWNKYSFFAIRDTWADNFAGNVRCDFDNGFEAGAIWLDGVILIDLTEAFGVGKEPSKVWCDAHIPFFNGKSELEYD